MKAEVLVTTAGLEWRSVKLATSFLILVLRLQPCVTDFQNPCCVQRFAVDGGYRLAVSGSSRALGSFGTPCIQDNIYLNVLMIRRGRGDMDMLRCHGVACANTVATL